jgi:hypothetical protein
MSRIDAGHGAGPAHSSATVELTCLHADGHAAEARSPVSPGADRGDSTSPIWETAWIDIGGEG